MARQSPEADSKWKYEVIVFVAETKIALAQA
jgi:hypothetical protein